MSGAANPLVGRRAVYTRIIKAWNDQERTMVETNREMFRGEIAGLFALNEQVVVVMLYDDGTLRQHAVESITIEGASPEGALR